MAEKKKIFVVSGFHFHPYEHEHDIITEVFKTREKAAKSICGYDFDVIETIIKKAYNSRYDFNGVYDWKQIWSAFLKEHKAREKRIIEEYKYFFSFFS